MALTKKRPETIKTTVTIKGQGETQRFDINFYNRRQSELEKLSNVNDLENFDFVAGLLFVIEWWDAEYTLDDAGIREAEEDLPGLGVAIMQAFHAARKVEKVKN